MITKLLAILVLICSTPVYAEEGEDDDYDPTAGGYYEESDPYVKSQRDHREKCKCPVQKKKPEECSSGTRLVFKYYEANDSCGGGCAPVYRCETKPGKTRRNSQAADEE
jgi:hypothetical protein